ncbi:MAG: quinone-dependent dihydroorotate dehydrogenase [Acidimicrobiia bacterium]
MYRALRALGFRLDPERAHRLALRGVRLARWAPRRRSRFVVEPVEAFGLRFRNPLGLAAGYDKDGSAWRALAALGFGHVEVGTVTPRPQPGNPRPRVHRLPEQTALINRMGFPSVGADRVAARLAGRSRPGGVVVGVSIGPNADTPPDQRIADYLTLVDRFSPLADYLAVNVSSPNTPGLRDLESDLAELLGPIVGRRDEWARRLGRRLPLLVKLSPDSEEFETAIGAAESTGVDGFVVGNTTTARPGIVDSPDGGLSGSPLAPIALDRLRRAVAATSLPIVASGGVMSPDDVRDRLEAGAVLVQMYTGLVYSGPRLLRDSLGALRGHSPSGRVF